VEADVDSQLANQGCTVVVPFREEMTKRHLKPTGDLGRVVFIVRGHLILASGSCFLRLTRASLRNTTCGIPNLLRRVSVTPMLSTTLLVVNIPRSEWSRHVSWGSVREGHS
jgi:hypothetical protein